MGVCKNDASGPVFDSPTKGFAADSVGTDSEAGRVARWRGDSRQGQRTPETSNRPGNTRDHANSPWCCPETIAGRRLPSKLLARIQHNCGTNQRKRESKSSLRPARGAPWGLAKQGAQHARVSPLLETSHPYDNRKTCRSLASSRLPGPARPTPHPTPCSESAEPRHAGPARQGAGRDDPGRRGQAARRRKPASCPRKPQAAASLQAAREPSQAGLIAERCSREPDGHSGEQGFSTPASRLPPAGPFMHNSGTCLYDAGPYSCCMWPALKLLSAK